MPTVVQTAGDMVDNLGNKIHYTTRRVGDQIETTTNQVLPPKQREHMLERAREYVHQNPKAAAFLTTQTALTGLPLVLFLAFATTTLLVSLSTCLFLGLLVSIGITFFLVGFALLFVVPTVIIASCSATFIFIWGFVGYIILRRFNEGEEPTKRGTRVGDKLHKLTGGRSGYFQGDQTPSESGCDRNVVASGKAAKGHDGGAGHAYGDVSSGSRDGGPVNGVNGTQGTVEWERKWGGVKSEPVVLDTENAFEVLKAEAPVS